MVEKERPLMVANEVIAAQAAGTRLLSGTVVESCGGSSQCRREGAGCLCLDGIVGGAS